MVQLDYLKMTKLEEDIKSSIRATDWTSMLPEVDPEEVMVKAAAEVAKKYIEKAFDYGQFAGNGMAQVISKQKALSKDEWLKENGVI